MKFSGDMKFLTLIFLFVSLVICAEAQTAAKIKLQNSASGKITLIKNKTRATLDLSRDVAGCGYVNAAIRKNFKDCAASPAEFALVDATAKNNQTYLLISTEAAGNCNVCGQCGADDAFGLIWLKLDKNLRVLDKKSVPIDFCRMDITPVSNVVDFKEETQEQSQEESLKLNFKDDILAVDFEKTLFDDGGNIVGYEFSHLEYRRKTPERGFVIKTEKREKSSVPEQ
jgi:hypothetical protein